MIPRATCEEAFHAAVAAQQAALPGAILAALQASGFGDRARHGLAIGKAALAMARGLGPVVDGIAVTPFDDGRELPDGWRRMVSSHPHVDERAVVAGDAVIEVVQRAPASAVIVALISGGGSALVEAPRVAFDEYRRVTRALTSAGATIQELNAVRAAISAIKGGQLLRHAAAPVITLAVSDVIGDQPETIASGPTVWRDPQRARHRASVVLQRHDLELALPPPLPLRPRPTQLKVIVPMNELAKQLRAELYRRGYDLPFSDSAFHGDVGYTTIHSRAWSPMEPGVFWGEPTVKLPADPGEGGRMQLLALYTAYHLKHTDVSMFAVGTDGVDGPPPATRPAPAGAYVDARTWPAIEAAGLDLADAMKRCNAGPALDAIGALVITGPTGLNSADVVVVG